MEKKRNKSIILAANWKENKNNNDISAFLNIFVENLGRFSKNFASSKFPEIIIAPSFVGLSFINTHLGFLNKDYKFNISIGAQNMDFHEKGAFTGEVSALMLKDHVRYVIIGHSERREYYNETDETVNKKILEALKHDIEIIFCVGEKKRERESGKYLEAIKKQILKGLKGVDKNQIHRIVIAYEPIWAIGTGVTPEPEDAKEVHRFIKDTIIEALGIDRDYRKNIPVLYGGSVKVSNIKSFIDLDDIDGALVGGASLDPTSFFSMVQICSNVEE